MSDSVKIASLELENLKKVRAVQIVPSQDGLTVIGGRNAQGKSSVLDAIAWALGGNKLKPDNPNRDGGATPAKLHVELSNGIVVERRGKNGALYVRDAQGGKGTQKLLDEFLSTLALDLRKFMAGSDRDKATALLQTLGIDRELATLDAKIAATFDGRRDAARLAKRDRAYADGLPRHEDAPDAPLLMGELSAKLMAAHDQNRDNAEKRDEAAKLAREHDGLANRISAMRHELNELEKQERDLYERATKAGDEVLTLVDVDTTEIERLIAEAEDVNAKVRENEAWARADEAAKKSEREQGELDAKLKKLRESRTALLDGAPLPLEGLAVDAEGRMTYRGQTWGGMSSAEQLRVATAIVQATKPDCGFVLVDELEKFDPQQLAEFGAWATERGLQVIGTRVGTDDACTIIIEDGKVEGQDLADPAAPDPRGKAIGWDEVKGESVTRNAAKAMTPATAPATAKAWGGASF